MTNCSYTSFIPKYKGKLIKKIDVFNSKFELNTSTLFNQFSLIFWDKININCYINFIFLSEFEFWISNFLIINLTGSTNEVTHHTHEIHKTPLATKLFGVLEVK
jgi:hypothetical protein